MHNFLGFIKNNALLVTTFAGLFLLIVLFHDLMTPFVIALIVVYLIEPMVKFMNEKLKIKGHKCPRGIAVICAYLLFLTVAVGVGFLFIPSVTSEISLATQELPKYYSKLKTEDLPRISQRFEEISFRLSSHSKEDIEAAYSETEEAVHRSIQAAMKDIDEISLPKIDTSGDSPLLVGGRRKGNEAQANTDADSVRRPSIFKFRQIRKDEYEVFPGDLDIVIQADGSGSYTIKSQPSENGFKTAKRFDLEREINKTVVDFAESSTKYAGSALTFLQTVIEFVVNAFISFILVMMLAAFISIDSPKMMNYVRSLFANKDGEAKKYDSYMKKLSKGLGGVVRGQLIICCIDGTLCGIGLAIIGVDYALLLGIIGGCLCIVPIFGTIIFMIPAVLLGLVKGPITAGLVVIVILLVHLLDTNFFTPKIVGKSSNMHPVIIIFALLAGQQVAGVLGLILALPVTSMIQTTLKFMLNEAKGVSNDDDDNPSGGSSGSGHGKKSETTEAASDSNAEKASETTEAPGDSQPEPASETTEAPSDSQPEPASETSEISSESSSGAGSNPENGDAQTDDVPTMAIPVADAG